MRQGKNVRRMAALAVKIAMAPVVAVVCLLALTTPAQAFDLTLHHPEGSYAQVKDTVWIHACDRDVDGHRVLAGYQFTAQTSDTWYSTANAPSGGCTEPIRSLTAIKNVRICVEHEGCRYWK